MVPGRIPISFGLIKLLFLHVSALKSWSHKTGFCFALSAPLSQPSFCERVESIMATKAIWNGTVIAATDNYEVVEGNVYFPPSSVNMQYAKPSSTHTTCGWKGQASYYTIEVDGKENKDAAWFYPSPKPAAQNIKDYVAFWKGVKVEKAAKA